jgi:hypothetical protein
MIFRLTCQCGQSIEVNADAGGQTFKCPNCGESVMVPEVVLENPFVSHIPQTIPIPQRQQVMTIEKTSKAYKGTMLIGSLMMIFGVCACAVSGSFSFGFLFLILGAFIYLFGRFNAWWNNG